MADTIDLRPGFADPVIDAQHVFRLALDSMARPGRIAAIPEGLNPPAPLSVGAAAICLALADHDTPIWLAPEIRTPAAIAFLKFHCGCPVVDTPANAAFAVADGATVPALDQFAIGDDAWPETSTTVIVQVDDLAAGSGLVLSGPGIETTHTLNAHGLRPDLWTEWRANQGLFPCGVDLILVAGNRIAALPRTTSVSEN
ncbi:phosphonate C-P lyase system protein PhnH [Thalassobaculum sp.]|uniref:phosphonate C-P lyase system protein PhnH n=1 Tax=Thalassobaculum sp. TaxID=2022740 RepID=UPI0032EC3B93